MRAFSAVLKTSPASLLFGDRPDDYSHIVRLLASVPPEKRRRIIRIIEEAVECAKQ